MLPTDIIFPVIQQQPDVRQYLLSMTNVLTQMYSDMAQRINGFVETWTPIIYGSTIAGVGTYDHQVGWYRRSGIMTELWMDVQWTGHTGTGNIIIQLPYLVAKSTDEPYVGSIQNVGGSAFTAGYTYLNFLALQGTINGQIMQSGSAVPSIALPISATGHFSGMITYIGQDSE